MFHKHILFLLFGAYKTGESGLIPIVIRVPIIVNV